MDIALNPETWDLDFKNNDLYLVVDKDCTEQYLGQKLGLYLGEWFLDPLKGIPYHDIFDGKIPEPTVLDSIFTREIMHTNGVKQLLAFDLGVDSAKRQLQVAFIVQEDSGVINFSQSLP